MTVIDRHDDCRNPRRGNGEMQCSVCGRDPGYPFVTWDTCNALPDLIFCVSCCANLKNGLQADFIQAVAIRDLRRTLAPRYQDQTLQRDTHERQRQEHQRLERPIRFPRPT